MKSPENEIAKKWVRMSRKNLGKKTRARDLQRVHPARAALSTEGAKAKEARAKSVARGRFPRIDGAISIGRQPSRRTSVFNDTARRERRPVVGVAVAKHAGLFATVCAREYAALVVRPRYVFAYLLALFSARSTAGSGTARRTPGGRDRESGMASDDTETREAREAAEEEDLKIFETLRISASPRKVNRLATHLTARFTPVTRRSHAARTYTYTYAHTHARRLVARARRAKALSGGSRGQ